MADPEIRRLWPDPDPRPLDDAGLIAAYAVDGGRPSVRMNFVTSVDGAVEVGGYSAGLGSPADRKVFDLLRMLCDGVMVGAGTLRHEGYVGLRIPAEHQEWRVRHGCPANPTLVVVSSRLDLDPDHPMFADAPCRPVVLTHAASPSDRRRALCRRADVLVCGGERIEFRRAVNALAARGLVRLLSEGGPMVLGALTAADVIDEMCVTVSPLLAGPGAGRITAGASTSPRGLALVHVLAGGDDLLLRYARRRPSVDLGNSGTDSGA